MEVITLGSGCFWCTEAIFQRVKGVNKAVSGYSGGKIKNPTYREICTGKTGHAEVVQVEFDPQIITTAEILEIFWKTHDPTTLNKQGNDVGTQYRSVIFFHNESQRELAEELKSELNLAKIWQDPIVTEIVPIDVFYTAEDYHQDYFNQNGNQPYCNFIVLPKVEKFKKVFSDKLKKS